MQTCDGRISHPRAKSTPCSDPDTPSSPCLQASVSRRSLVVNAKDGKTVVVGLAADSGGYSQQEQLQTGSDGAATAAVRAEQGC